MNDYPIQPVTFEKVTVTEGFWAERLATSRRSTLPACFKKCEETGRIHNFEAAGGLKEGGFKGIYFNDSDLFKIIEGAAYSLTIKPDPELEAYVDGVIEKIAAAQEEDGYLYTARTIGDPKYNYPGKQGRWTHCRDGHELYNVGHMYEGAVAYYQATGKRNFLDVAIKSADLVCKVFGEGEGQRVDVPGHQEIEMGLVKLYRLTGDRKYLDQANFFLEMRGCKDKRKELYNVNRQDHLPVKEQKEAVGHAVRAGYMYAGMADVAALTGDQAMIDAADTIWDNITSKKLYLTGGVGGSRHGEAFAGNYQLPNRVAYNETCAAIANVLFNHRMFLLHGDAKYMDVIERTIYNGFLSGVSLQGDTYFYPNPLSSDGVTRFNHGAGAERSPWFGCSCCPANIVRFVPSIPGYMYAVKDDSLYVNLFAAGSAEIEVGGQKVKLTQQTRYPWDGRIEIAVEPEQESEFTLRVRVPGWARGEVAPGGLYQESGGRSQGAGVRGQVSGEAIDTTSLENGYLVIRRKWTKGDSVVLDLPMDIRRVVCDEKVEANRGRVAFERGPIVYCAEGADHDGHALNLWVPDDAVLEAKQRDDLPGKPVALMGQAKAAVRSEDGRVTSSDAAMTLIPYYAWCHRGPNEMRVWLPRAEQGADVAPAPTIASKSRATASHHWKSDHIEALNDLIEPTSSGDHTIPRFTWWDHKGSTEWVQYDFEEATEVSSVEVYWFDDTGRGQCRVPTSWRLLSREGDKWIPVKTSAEYGVEKDRYNRVGFEPTETGALRLEVELHLGFSGGILEWRVRDMKFCRDTVKQPLVVAHRGASKLAPENTLPAFELAWKQGADAIEGDFRLAKDGQVVCIHDGDTKRTTGKELVVAESTLGELRELDAGAWRGDAFKGVRIPTLAEVLATVPVGKRIYIELKSGAEIIPALVNGIEQSGLSNDQIVVICFDQNVLKQLRAVAPQYTTSWLVAFKKDKAGVVAPSFEAVLDTVAGIKADGLSSSQHHVNADFVDRLRDRGVEHHVWTVNDAAVAKRFESWESKSITTDVPADILAAFAEHPVKTSAVQSSEALKRYVE